MAKVLVDESCFSGIADAIREKTSSTATYKPREMADAISKIQGGAKTKFGLSVDNFVGDVDADGAMKPFSSNAVDIVFDGVTKVGKGFFAKNPPVRSVSFPDLATVGDYGLHTFLYQCDALETVDFPALSSADGSYALAQTFSLCKVLHEVSFPALTSVNGTYVLYQLIANSKTIAKIAFPELVYAKGTGCFMQLFYYCSELASAEFPKLRIVDCNEKSTSSGKQFCNIASDTSVTELRFPSLEELYANGSSSSDAPFYSAFRPTYGVSNKDCKMYFPKLVKIGTHYTGTRTVSDTAIRNMFCGCSYLKEIHFGAANQAAVEAMPGYDTLWGLGAGKATVYFDL